jgi:formate dehydrogenase major subunit
MSLIQEIDYGTPESKSEKMVTLTIDGVPVTVPEGTSVMRAAMEMGTQIPSSAPRIWWNPSAPAASA